MNDITSQAAQDALLDQLFNDDTKRFEWMAKQYYDLFAYHAAQRLTAFNFFLVSLSFFSNAYATLITRSGDSEGSYYSVAATLAFSAYLLIIAFGRLDKRNEQIIRINEAPLKRIQATIQRALDPNSLDEKNVWQTFRRAERTYIFRSFSHILPFIYGLAATACACGAVYAFTGPGSTVSLPYLFLLAALVLIAWLAILCPLSKRRPDSGS